MNEKKHQIVIVGGGTAGITLAATLKRKSGGADLDIAIIEPSENHYYQPAFTLVGAGDYQLEKTRRNMRDLIPTGVEWIKAGADSFDPENNQLTLDSGGTANMAPPWFRKCNSQSCSCPFFWRWCAVR